MINLLPVEEKRKIRRMYRIRVAVVSLCFAAAMIAVSLASLLPSFFAASSKYSAAALSSQMAESENAAVKEDLEKRVKDANRAVSLLAGSGGSSSPRGLFLEIISRKPAGIRITAISYSAEAPAAKGGAQGSPPKRVIVGGTAATRENLLSFMNALKSEEMFASADLPISNFVKDRNLDFSINILLSTSSKTAIR